MSNDETGFLSSQQAAVYLGLFDLSLYSRARWFSRPDRSVSSPVHPHRCGKGDARHLPHPVAAGARVIGQKVVKVSWA